MKLVRLGVLTSLVVCVATAVNAAGAKLEATTDAGSYVPGATVTITLTATSDPYYDETTHIDVRIVGSGFTEVSTEQAVGGTCLDTWGCLPGTGWAVGGTQGATVLGNYQAFSQIAGTMLTPITNNMEPAQISPIFLAGESTITAVFRTTAGPEGTYDIDLAAIGVGFFDVQGPATLATYTVMVPEPGAGPLLGLGLMLLAVSGRRPIPSQGEQNRRGAVHKIFR